MDSFCSIFPRRFRSRITNLSRFTKIANTIRNFFYTQFQRLPLIDRLSALPLLYSLIDFDNSHEAWRRYHSIIARELFKNFGVSKRLYQEAFEPMLLVALFAPSEQCSAAATSGKLYYFILSHQPDFDIVWCRGTVGEKIFRPWVKQIGNLGTKVLSKHRVTDVIIDHNLQVKTVVRGDEILDADAIIFSVCIIGMKKVVSITPSLQSYEEFRNLNNLGAIDVLATRLWFDREVDIHRPSNACLRFEDTTAWTFFDLNTLHDEFKNSIEPVVDVGFYYANQFIDH